MMAGTRPGEHSGAGAADEKHGGDHPAGTVDSGAVSSKKRSRSSSSPSTSDSSSEYSAADSEQEQISRRRKEAKHKSSKKSHKEHRKDKKHKKDKKRKRDRKAHKKSSKKQHKKSSKHHHRDKSASERSGSPVQLSKFLRKSGDSSDSSSQEEGGERISVITGLPIKMDRGSSTKDKIAEKQRKQYLKWLNAGYD